MSLPCTPHNHLFSTWQTCRSYPPKRSRCHDLPLVFDLPLRCLFMHGFMGYSHLGPCFPLGFTSASLGILHFHNSSSVTNAFTYGYDTHSGVTAVISQDSTCSLWHLSNVSLGFYPDHSCSDSCQLERHLSHLSLQFTMTQTLMMVIKLHNPSPQPGPVCHVT